MASKTDSLVVGEVEHMQLLGRVIPFLIVNASTVSTVETRDLGGRKRGGIAIGLASADSNAGFATICSIAEAEATVQLLQCAIDDAKRIERGEVPLAREGFQRKDN